MKTKIILRVLISIILLILAEHSFAGWEGRWQYDESWRGPSENWESIITILNIHLAHGKYIIDIDSDGHMALTRIQGEAKLSKHHLQITFLKNREGHIGPDYHPGELLLELTRWRGRVITTWHAIEAETEVEKKQGVRFYRSNN